MKYVYAVIAVVALFAGTWWAAHHQGVAEGRESGLAESSKTIAGLRADLQLAQADRDASVTSLANVKRLLDQQRESMEARAALFVALLDNRDQLQKQLDTLARQRQSNVLKVGHEDPQCAALARLPVCPAVAERLWGEAAGDPLPAAASH